MRKQKVVWALSYTRKITRLSECSDPAPPASRRPIPQTKTLSVSAFSHTFVNPPDHQIRYHLSFFFFFVQSTLSHGESRPRQATRSHEPRQMRPQWTCRVLQKRTSVSLQMLLNVWYPVVRTVHVPPRRTQANALALSFPPMSWFASSDKKSSASKSTSAA